MGESEGERDAAQLLTPSVAECGWGENRGAPRDALNTLRTASWIHRGSSVEHSSKIQT